MKEYFENPVFRKEFENYIKSKIEYQKEVLANMAQLTDGNEKHMTKLFREQGKLYILNNMLKEVNEHK